MQDKQPRKRGISAAVPATTLAPRILRRRTSGVQTHSLSSKTARRSTPSSRNLFVAASNSLLRSVFVAVTMPHPCHRVPAELLFIAALGSYIQKVIRQQHPLT